MPTVDAAEDLANLIMKQGKCVVMQSADIESNFSHSMRAIVHLPTWGSPYGWEEMLYIAQILRRDLVDRFLLNGIDVGRPQAHSLRFYLDILIDIGVVLDALYGDLVMCNKFKTSVSREMAGPNRATW